MQWGSPEGEAELMRRFVNDDPGYVAWLATHPTDSSLPALVSALRQNRMYHSTPSVRARQ